MTSKLNYNTNGYKHDAKPFAKMIRNITCIFASVLRFFLTSVLLPWYSFAGWQPSHVLRFETAFSSPRDHGKHFWKVFMLAQ